MFMPRDHPLRSMINQQIQWAVECGLIEKWASESQFKFKRPINQHIGPTVLTLEHIFLGWMFYIVFATLASLTFAFEQLVYRMVRKPNPKRFWKISEMLIDGDRHFLLPPSGKARQWRQRAWASAFDIDAYWTGEHGEDLRYIDGTEEGIRV